MANRDGLSAELLARLAALPLEKRAIVERRLRELGSTDAVPSIVRTRRDVAMPLSFAEARLWFIDQYEPGTSTYNLPVATRLHGRMDRAALSRALDAIVERHELLRTRYTSDSGQPVRVIEPAAHVNVDEARIDAGALAAWLKTEAGRPFDLSKGPLFRVALAAV